MSNNFKGKRIEFHVLQTFPVTCLNRDEDGSPKTARIGGTTRARVSSQCWKRQIRMTMKEQGVVCSNRTKLIKKLVIDECLLQGAPQELAIKCGEKIEKIFIKTDEKKNEEEQKEKSDTLLFFSQEEISKIVSVFKQHNFNVDEVITQKEEKKQAKEFAKIIGKPTFSVNGIDIALFGRMVAQASSLKVEGAASFSHAISTHKISNEIEFFTALDDNEVDHSGAGHMGSLEFNSATYYRYINLDLGKLYDLLAGNNISEAVEAFTKALFTAIPIARQNSMSGQCHWNYAKIYIRSGQPVQMSFEKSVDPKNGSILEESKNVLKENLDKQKKLFGSLFGEEASIEYGEENGFDDIITMIKNYISKVNI
jgi:CRISPR system Cascade subunit CasC